jgi:hypothetical protein
MRSEKLSAFERIFISAIAIASGLMIAYLSIMGPLVLDKIIYRTSLSGIYQIQGQDLANLLLISPLLIIGGILLFLKKKSCRYLLILTPVNVIYYVLSYVLGMEWSNPEYTGNIEKYTYYFLFLLISAFLILLYTLPSFKEVALVYGKKSTLNVYSAICVIFAILFALMWLKDVNEVIATGTALSYAANPTAFWVIRYFDLGFSIPLLLISTYLLWSRSQSSFPMLMLSYGFFITMVTAVDSMAIVMLANHDPSATIQSLLFFIGLSAVVYTGFIFILRIRRAVKE